MGQVQRRATAVATAVSLALGGTAIAQDGETAGEIEEIVVKGIRSSLTNSASVKRNATGVVDAITAVDIGKFPDTNLAESLQRIPGVSIDRANNEGNQVTVRGFGPSFNLVTLNNRQMPNSSALQAAGISRSFNFREIAAESVSGVNVYKTGRAHVPSGGIGATIDVKTAKPFDYGGFRAFLSGTAIVDTSVEKGDDVTPEVSGMISQTFADGKFGVLLSASHSERQSRKDRVGTQGWIRNRGTVDTSAIDTSRNPTLQTFAPWTVDVDNWDYERERQNGQLVLQFAPTDRLSATLDYTVSRFEEIVAMNRQSYWFDNPVGDADENGTLWNPRNPNDELNFWAWEFFEEKENDSVGLNIEWQATDTLSFTLDFHDSTSHSNPDGDTAETLANLKNPAGSVALIGADFVGDIPAVIVDDSSLAGGSYEPANIVADLYQKRGYEMENDIRQLQLHGSWENQGDGALTRINFGIANTEYDFDAALSATFSFVDPDFAGVDLDISGLGLFFVPIGDTADQFGGTENLFPLIPQYDVNTFIGIVEAADLFFVNPPTLDGVSEETLAAYLSFDFETEFNGLPVTLNAGVRYEETDVDAFSVQNGIVALNFRQPEELQIVFDDQPTPQSLTGNYTRILPNADFRMDFTDEWVGRFSYSRTLSRAGIGAMFPSTTLNAPRPGDPFRASQGNPNLLPLTSDNFDFSVEWYYDEGSYASVGYFRKFVENFIGASFENRVIFDVNGNPLTDPSANPRAGCPDASNPPNPNCLSQPGDPVITWEVATPGNLENAEVDGWELNAQHMFGDSGFGAIANFTLVEGDVEFDVFRFDQTLALTGLSDSANLVGFYERDRFEARIAYNWRDDFLLTILGSGEPVFTEAYGQWDIAASFQVNDSVEVFVEGLNVTDETVRRHGRFPEQLVDAEQYGPRYHFGVRATF